MYHPLFFDTVAVLILYIKYVCNGTTTIAVINKHIISFSWFCWCIDV